MRRITFALISLCLLTSTGNTQNSRAAGTVPGQGASFPASDKRGTDEAPIAVKIVPTLKTEAEAADEKADREEKNLTDTWMIRLTGGLVLVGIAQLGVFILQLFVFGLQAKRLRESVEKMDEIAQGQSQDMQNSIAQWKRVASAMEGVSGAMASNVSLLGETNGLAKKNLETNKRIADRQEMIGELQTRAFIAVSYVGLVPQNNDTGYRFEPRMVLTSTGLTPAYKVRYRAVCDVLQFPLPDDFSFPMPDTPPNGTGMLGPRNTFTISAVAPRMYSELEIKELKAGTTRRLYMYGVVDYEDAFGKPRYVKFSQSIMWFVDGVTTTGFNTVHHNDAN